MDLVRKIELIEILDKMVNILKYFWIYKEKLNCVKFKLDKMV